MRLRPIRWRGWRIDSEHPARWNWDSFVNPRNRFDPPSGRFRVRYAADLSITAARERFPSRRITPADGDLWLVRLDGLPSGLHLTHQQNLDVLGLDDRISTGRLDLDRAVDPDPLLDVAGALSDALFDWWDGAPPPIVYRARTAPDQRSVAFGGHIDFEVGEVGRLRQATRLHAHLVLAAGFTVPTSWLR